MHNNMAVNYKFVTYSFYYFIVTCPEGFVQYNRKCYKFSEEEATWDDARSACQSLSEDGAYDLVSIDSQELATALKQYPDHWIGLDDKLIEGAFTWVNGQGLGVGSTLGEDPWGANEPNVNHNNIVIIDILSISQPINVKFMNAIVF